MSEEKETIENIENATPPTEAAKPETETPQTEPEAAPRKKQAKPATMEERMLEMLLREKHGELLDKALAEGKTIRGAWNYVVSVMKNAYIAEHGRVNGGCCGNADVVVAIAERYLREFKEGTIEPETKHTPAKKPDTESVKKKVVETAKAAARAARKESERKAERKPKKEKLTGTQQLSFNF